MINLRPEQFEDGGEDHKEESGYNAGGRHRKSLHPADVHMASIRGNAFREQKSSTGTCAEVGQRAAALRWRPAGELMGLQRRRGGGTVSFWRRDGRAEDKRERAGAAGSDRTARLRRRRPEGRGPPCDADETGASDG